MSYVDRYESPLGPMTMESDGKHLTGLWFDGQKYFPETIKKEAPQAELPVFDETIKWLDAYFSGADPGFTPETAPAGTPFRTAVWKILMTIPYGHTMSYGEVAAALAEQMQIDHMSAQAVGGAVGHNPISLIIPCHRVVGSDGSLTGYAGGLDRKEKLLALEEADSKRR